MNFNFDYVKFLNRFLCFFYSAIRELANDEFLLVNFLNFESPNDPLEECTDDDRGILVRIIRKIESNFSGLSWANIRAVDKGLFPAYFRSRRFRHVTGNLQHDLRKGGKRLVDSLPKSDLGLCESRYAKL